MTSWPPSPPAISLRRAGTAETIERAVAGPPIEIVWPADGPLRRFVEKAISWAYDDAVTVGELYNLVYGDQNPLLDASTGRAVVRRATHANPAWTLLNELIDRKRVAFGHVDPHADPPAFGMSEMQAARHLRIVPAAVRELVAAGHLAARQDGDSYTLDWQSVEAYRRSDAYWRLDAPPWGEYASDPDEPEPAPPPDGPSASAAVRARFGHGGGVHLRIKGAAVTTESQEGQVFEGPVLPGWQRLHVLAYWDNGRARYLAFEPAPGTSLEWKFRDFFLRGELREVSHENNARRAREAFDAVGK